MKETGILMRGPLVIETLEGRKTQTRRIVDIKKFGGPSEDHDSRGEFRFENGLWQSSAGKYNVWSDPLPCPYGRPGDRLWVREEHYRFGNWEKLSGVKTKLGRSKWRFVCEREQVRFNPPSAFRKGRHAKDPTTSAWHKRLARFMPKKLCRLTLEILMVRVERLQDISRGDAMAEGCPFRNMAGGDDPRQWYAELWESINGPGSWKLNSWVWAITFKKL